MSRSPLRLLSPSTEQRCFQVNVSHLDLISARQSQHRSTDRQPNLASGAQSGVRLRHGVAPCQLPWDFFLVGRALPPIFSHLHSTSYQTQFVGFGVVSVTPSPIPWAGLVDGLRGGGQERPGPAQGRAGSYSRASHCLSAVASRHTAPEKAALLIHRDRGAAHPVEGQEHRGVGQEPPLKLGLKHWNVDTVPGEQSFHSKFHTYMVLGFGLGFSPPLPPPNHFTANFILM